MKRRKITVTTYYEFTQAGFADYLEILKTSHMTPHEFDEFVKTGRVERNSVDEDGSRATTTHQVLE